jgi:succinoglycan biosynthesis protein ExoO
VTVTNTPVVSVVMANYNGARHLPEAVASLQAQTFSGWELVLVDDASSDDSVRLASALALGDRRIKVLAQPHNRGPSAARNRALKAAAGAWIAIADSDDVMRPDRLERLLRLARAEDAELVADNQMICSADLAPLEPFIGAAEARRLRRVGLVTFIESSRLYSSLPDLGFLKPMIHAGLIARSGAAYDEGLRIGEDFHFLATLLKAGAWLHLEPEPLYLYRKHGGSISHRMRPEVIEAMIRADRRLQAALNREPEAAAAMGRRIEGLRSWAVHEAVMSSAKSGRWLPAAARALQRPHAWRLISRPLRQKLAVRLKPSADPGPELAPPSKVDEVGAGARIG